MEIAITGASGLIGGALVRRLEADGHHVLRLVRRTPQEGEAHWDPAAGTIDAGALDGIDAVVHLAGEGIGEKRWTAEQKTKIRTSRVQGTSLLAAAIADLDRPPATFVVGSAIGYYGDTGDRAVDETAPPGDDFLASICVDWESAARPATVAGIRTVLARTGIVLSVDGGALARQLPFFKLGLGGRSGNGRQYQSWISIDDEAAALAWLLTAEVDGPVNLTAPEPVTNAEFAKTLGRVLHRPTTIIPMAGPRLLFGRELADALLLTSALVTPSVLTTHGFEFSHPKLDAALTDLLR